MRESGGRNRTRTCDPLVVIQVLCQLSYPPLEPAPADTPSWQPRDSWAHLDSNQGLAGYEPAALDR
jgi:hypothetical protein